MYDEDDARADPDGAIQANGQVDENIHQVLEDLRGGKRYWRVTW